MTNFEMITVDINGGIAKLRLNRPDVRNALNPKMIGEITDAFTVLSDDDLVRVIVIDGMGDTFCAGGDLNWMKDVLGQSEAEVMEDSRHLLNMYHAIHSCPKLVISAVQGAAIAGALGILSCSDVVIAEAKTVFCLSEVKIGLVPGIVGTFLIPRLGLSWFRYFAKTGIAFDTETARTAGLIHEIADSKNKVEERVYKHIKLALSASPAAIAKTNDLIGSIGYKLKEDALSAGLLFNAQARLSEEAQEGISSFLDKREPAWHLDPKPK